MTRFFWMCFLTGCCVGHCSAESVIVAVTYRNEAGNTVEQKGTAVAIHSNDRGSILLTCKHVVQDAPESVWIKSDGDWHQCHHVRQHPSEDVAVMECPVRLRATAIADTVPDGAQVVVDGAGPALHGTDEPWYFEGVALSDGIHNPDGLAIIKGDSGGPVYVRTSTGKYAIGGIAYGCRGNEPTARRAHHRGHDAVTLYTPCSVFIPWIETQYCPQGNCPIQIRRQVIQPVGPLGFPRGPARVIGIAEPVPQQYEPVPRQRQPEPVVRPQPDRISVTGPPGPSGSQGPRGEPGLSVTQQQVEGIVNAWLDSNIDRIRGPQGEPGLPGRDCLPGDSTGLDARLTELERRQFRMILASDGKVIDDETYEPGQPVVLDLKRLRSVSGGR